MNNSVHLLWTGGWDSTFRLVELSFEDIDIYPVYVIDPNRRSKELEIKSMNDIIDALNKKPKTKARIHNIEQIPLDSIPEDAEITNAYHIIEKQTHLGSQHEWLARLGKLKPGMEMGTEAGSPETSHILKTIRDFSHLVIENDTGYLDPVLSSKEGMLVLGWFKFPIITRTEQDMLKQVKDWGYEDVMKKIWFCHTPIQGEPCGCCHACEVKCASDMTFLLSDKAQKRYKIYRRIPRFFGNRLTRYTVRIIRKLI